VYCGCDLKQTEKKTLAKKRKKENIPINKQKTKKKLLKIFLGLLFLSKCLNERWYKEKINVKEKTEAFWL